jgi:hypothetical protein
LAVVAGHWRARRAANRGGRCAEYFGAEDAEPLRPSFGDARWHANSWAATTFARRAAAGSIGSRRFASNVGQLGCIRARARRAGHVFFFA